MKVSLGKAKKEPGSVGFGRGDSKKRMRQRKERGRGALSTVLAVAGGPVPSPTGGCGRRPPLP
jgi:hypothetical protein